MKFIVIIKAPFTISDLVYDLTFFMTTGPLGGDKILEYILIGAGCGIGLVFSLISTLCIGLICYKCSRSRKTSESSLPTIKNEVDLCMHASLILLYMQIKKTILLYNLPNLESGNVTVVRSWREGKAS